MGEGNFVAEIDKILVRNMKHSRDLLMLVSIIFFIGCETETEYIWNDENRISEYATWIDNTICRQTVDNLDFMFQASAYRDSLLCGGDVNAVIKRQFSNPHLKPPKVNELGEICWFETQAEHYITHNGISLDEDGSLWIAYGKMQRFWDAHQQPVEEYCQWAVSRENGVYTLSGGMIHNGVFNEFFTMSNFLDMHFTTSVAEVMVCTDIDNNIYETKQTLRYSFNGDIMAVASGKVDYDRLPRPDVYMTLDGVTGHNTKEYIEGIPVFGSVYFDEGTTTATLSNGTDSWRIVIDYAQGGYNYSRL